MERVADATVPWGAVLHARDDVALVLLGASVVKGVAAVPVQYFGISTRGKESLD